MEWNQDQLQIVPREEQNVLKCPEVALKTRDGKGNEAK